MIEIVLIGIGGGTFLGGGLCALDSKELGGVLISIIGLIILIIGIAIPIINDSDCRNYCQCNGQFHYYNSFEGACECLSMPKAFADCKTKCKEREPFYNQYTGRCYCT